MFGRRLHIFTSLGIKIGIDLSWIFIAVLLSWSLAAGHFPYYYPNLSSEIYWLMGISGMVGLFACILLHEMGHAVVAKHFNLPVTHITLFIFGGVAEIKKDPPNPKVEFLVSIAGPIVSVILAFLMYALTLFGEEYGWPVEVVGITSYLAMINAILVLFNMIPAFPLDGGRVLRALLWWWKDNLGWATNVAASLGIGFGFVLLVLGFLSLVSENFITGVWLIIIGLFLQGAAASYRTQYYVGKGLRDQKVAKFMTANPISVPPDITIKTFVEKYVYDSFHHLYPVTDNGKLIGTVSTKEIKSLPHASWEETLVEQVMVPESNFRTVTPDTSAIDALTIMNQTDSPTLMVLEGCHLVGIVTSHNLFKIVSLKLELDE